MKVGVIGGGQLGQMLALAALPLGIRLAFYDPSPDACAGLVGDLTVGRFDDGDKLLRWAQNFELVTYEFENVSLETLKILDENVLLRPSLAALEVSQDRIFEKTLFRRLEIPTNDFRPVETAAEIVPALKELGGEAILKTRRLGYDGKGQWVVAADADAPTELPAPCILEAKVNFVRELSQVLVRSSGGDLRFYPLVENHHSGGILRTTIAPAKVSEALTEQAQHIGRRLAEKWEYVGVMAIEFFETEDEMLLVNEIAPRVHNSGHWSQDGAFCSQFENHIRAICDIELGSTEVKQKIKMENIISTLPNLQQLPSEKAAIHLYHKEERSGRKLGHINHYC